jgi:hypothetical protein
MTPEELELTRWTLRGTFWLLLIVGILWCLTRKEK